MTRAPMAKLRLEFLEDRSVPATFNVTTALDVVDPADGKRSLREAVTAANSLAGPDVIVVPTGVYRITLAGAGEDANATGDFDITDSVTVQGAGAAKSLIDGQQLDRAFDVIGTASHSIKVVLLGLTVRNGNATGDGGAIQVANADLVLRDCAVIGSRASLTGGGIAGLVGSPNVTLVRTVVARNAVEFDGGGVHAITAKLTDCTVRRNVVTQGIGGVLASTATLTNCTVGGNSAEELGGGVWALTATLLNCTISENLANNGGGLFHEPGGPFSIRNTIIALNLVEFVGTDADISGDFTSQGHNLVGNGAGATGFTNGVNGNIVGTAANLIDPKLGPLANNGGRTKTHKLLAGSLAIDAGDNAGVPPTDQRGAGFPRLKDGNFDGVAVVDIGAFER